MTSRAMPEGRVGQRTRDEILKQSRYPRIIPKWQSDAITAQGITVVYPDDVTPVRKAST